MVEPVNVTAFVACDKVIEESGNRKKTIIGIFRNFNFPELPSRFAAPWFLFAQISGLTAGKHDITVNVVHDATQGVVFASGMDIPEDHADNVDLIIPAQGTEFRKEGDHVATLSIDGTQVAYYVLRVVLRRTPG
jgi:hypothetical protein